MPSSGARLGETANDYLVHLRFGRKGVLAGYEKPEARAKLASLHAAIGTDRQLTDADIVGVQVKEEVATVVAQIAWYSPGEQLLRASTIEQRWAKVSAGQWLLEDESVVGGDSQFFGAKEAASPSDSRAPAPAKELGKGAHVPSVRIGGASP